MKALSVREAVLALLSVGVIVVLGWYNFFRTSDPAAGGKTSATGGAAEASPAADIPLLALERKTELPELDDSKLRNLFNYSKSPEEYEAERRDAERIKKLEEEAAKRQKEEQERLAREAEERAKWASEHPAPPAPPEPPVMSLRFLGYLGKPEDKLAVIADIGSAGDLHIVSKGEVIDGKFKVLEIDFESVTLGFTDARFSDQQRTLRMGG